MFKYRYVNKLFSKLCLDDTLWKPLLNNPDTGRAWRQYQQRRFWIATSSDGLVKSHRRKIDAKETIFTNVLEKIRQNCIPGKCYHNCGSLVGIFIDMHNEYSEDVHTQFFSYNMDDSDEEVFRDIRDSFYRWITIGIEDGFKLDAYDLNIHYSLLELHLDD